MFVCSYLLVFLEFFLIVAVSQCGKPTLIRFDVNSTRDLEINQGDLFLIVCEMAGDPPLTSLTIRDNHAVLGIPPSYNYPKVSYFVKSAKCVDYLFRYSCWGENDDGKLSVSLISRVLCEPWLFKSAQTNFIIPLGQRFAGIYVGIGAYPWPTFDLERFDQCTNSFNRRVEDRRVQNSFSGPQLYTVQHRDINEKDYGVYRLTAVNNLGDLSVNITIQPSYDYVFSCTQESTYMNTQVAVTSDVPKTPTENSNAHEATNGKKEISLTTAEIVLIIIVFLLLALVAIMAMVLFYRRLKLIKSKEVSQPQLSTPVPENVTDNFTSRQNIAFNDDNDYDRIQPTQNQFEEGLSDSTYRYISTNQLI